MNESTMDEIYIALTNSNNEYDNRPPVLFVSKIKNPKRQIIILLLKVLPW